MQNISPKEMGANLAVAHKEMFPKCVHNGILLDGSHLNFKCQELNMPVCKKINKALIKIDAITHRINLNITHPFVKLQYWNKFDIKPFYYGNPAWDIGAAIVSLNNGAKAESFLQEYVNNEGVIVTIIELYLGILYTKIYNAVVYKDFIKLEQLAKHECSSILYETTLSFSEISADALNRIGLPGLYRS
jgi:hypothetical protein